MNALAELMRASGVPELTARAEQASIVQRVTPAADLLPTNATLSLARVADVLEAQALLARGKERTRLF